MIYDPTSHRVKVQFQRQDRLTEAFVLLPHAAGNLDINGAQAVYLSQPRVNDSKPDFGRVPLFCICSDEKCRGLSPQPRITAIAYAEAQKDGSYKRGPHWRWHPDDWHHRACFWLLREVAQRLETEERRARIKHIDDASSGSSDKYMPRQQTPRRTDHVDVFVVSGQNDDTEEAPKQRLVPSDIDGRTLLPTVQRIREGLRYERDHPSTTSILRQVVSSYDRLKAEGRSKEEVLAIEGVTRSFYDWFRMLSLYSAVNASEIQRIWSGGASATHKDDRYVLYFYDKVNVGDRQIKPRLTLTDELLNRHRRGPFLREAVRECLEGDARYVKVYWYGQLDVNGWLVTPDLSDDLDRLHIAAVY